jgi:hypothetical protein
LIVHILRRSNSGEASHSLAGAVARERVHYIHFVAAEPGDMALPMLDR